MVIASEAHISLKNIREGNPSKSQVNISERTDKENIEEKFSKSAFESMKIVSFSNKENVQEISYEDDIPSTTNEVRNANPTWETYHSIESSKSDSITLRKIHKRTSESSKSNPSFKLGTKNEKARHSFLFIPNNIAKRNPSKNDSCVSKDDEETIRLEVKDTRSKHRSSGPTIPAKEVEIPPEKHLHTRSSSRAIIINPLHVEETLPDSKITLRGNSRTHLAKMSAVSSTSQSMGKITKVMKSNLHSAPELSMQNTCQINASQINPNTPIINSKTVTYLDSVDSHFDKERVVSFKSEQKRNTSDGSVVKIISNTSQNRKQAESMSLLKTEKSHEESEKENAVIQITNRNSSERTNKSRASLKSHSKTSHDKVENIVNASLEPVCMTMDNKNRSDSLTISEETTKYPDIASMTLKRLVTSSPKLSDLRSPWQLGTPSYSSLQRPVSQISSQKKYNTENSSNIEVKSLVRSESYVIVGKCNKNQIKNERASDSSVPPAQNLRKNSPITTGTRNLLVLQKKSFHQTTPNEGAKTNIILPKINNDTQTEITPPIQRIAASKSLPKTQHTECTRYVNEENEVVIHPTIQAIRSKMRLIEKTRKEVERLSQATRQIIKESWADDIQLRDDKLQNIVQFKLREGETPKHNINSTKSRTNQDTKKPFKSNFPTAERSESKRGKYNPRTIEIVKNSAPRNFIGIDKSIYGSNNYDSKQKTSQTHSRTQSVSRSSSGSTHAVKSRSQMNNGRSYRPQALPSTISVQERRKPSTIANPSLTTAANASLANMTGVLGANSGQKSEKNYIQLNIIRAKEKQTRNKTSSKKQCKITTKSKVSVITYEPKETKTSPDIKSIEKAEKMDGTDWTTNEKNKQTVNTFPKKSSDVIINLPNLTSVVGMGSPKLSYTSHKVITTSQKTVPRILPLNRVQASIKFTSTETHSANRRELFNREKLFAKGQRSSSDKSQDRSMYRQGKDPKKEDENVPRNNNIQSITKTFISSHLKITSQNDTKIPHNRPHRQNSAVSNRSRRSNNVRKTENCKGNEIDQSEKKIKRKNVTSAESPIYTKRNSSRSKDEIDSLFERGNSKTIPVPRVSRKSGNIRLHGSRDFSNAPSNLPGTRNNNPDNTRHRSVTPGSKFTTKYENVAVNSSEKKDSHPKSGSSEKRQANTRTTSPDLREMRKRDSVPSEVGNNKINSASEVVSKFERKNTSGRPRFRKSYDLGNKSCNSRIPNTTETSIIMRENSAEIKDPELTKRAHSSRPKNVTTPSTKFSSITRAKIDNVHNLDRKAKERLMSQNVSGDKKTSDFESKEGNAVSRRPRSRTPSTFTKLVDNQCLIETTLNSSDSSVKTQQLQPKMQSVPSKIEGSRNDYANQTSGEANENTATSRFSRRSITSSMIDHCGKRDGSLTSNKTRKNSTVSEGKSRISSRNIPEPPKKDRSELNISNEVSRWKNDTLRNTPDIANKEESIVKSSITLNPKRGWYPSSKLRNNVVEKVAKASDSTNNIRTITIRSQHQINQEFKNTISASYIEENVKEVTGQRNTVNNLTFHKETSDPSNAHSGISHNVIFRNENSDILRTSTGSPDYVLDATGTNPTNANIVALDIEEFALTQDMTEKKSDPKLTTAKQLKSCPLTNTLESEKKNDDNPLVIGDISQGIAVIIKPKSKYSLEQESNEKQKSLQDINKAFNETGDDIMNQSKSMPLGTSEDSAYLPSVTYMGFNVQPHKTINAVVIAEEPSDNFSDHETTETDEMEDPTRKTVFLSIDSFGSLYNNAEDSFSNSPVDSALTNEKVNDEEQSKRSENPHLTIRQPLVRAITILTRNRKEDEENNRSPSRVGSVMSFACDEDVGFLTASDSERNLWNVGKSETQIE